MNNSTCSIDGCERPYAARGWCHRHYARWRKHGNPGSAAIAGSRSGNKHHNWLGDKPSYGALHHRLRTVLGAASAHKCCLCDKPAAHWSYDGDDKNQLLGAISNFRNYAWYSVNPNHYQPMCVKCHRVVDGRRNREELAEYRLLKHKTGLNVDDFYRLADRKLPAE